MTTPRVSLVIPVYDPGPYLEPALDSVAAQDLAAEELEVVLVDDGSTDGSAAALDAFAAGRPDTIVIHQENSGWPGRPRNVGLERSRGTYVFFMDADDVLGPQALRRLADFADEHDSDVVLPKMLPLGGRRVAQSIYARTCVDADRAAVFGSLTPSKLLRRSFVEAQALRFPEGRVRLEDGMVMARAYLTARRVSIYADYDCYFLRERDDGGNISARLGVAREYCDAVARVLAIAREHSDDPDLLARITADLYGRKVLRQIRPERYFADRPERRRAWVRAVHAFAREHVDEAVEAHLPLEERLRSRLIRRNRRERLRLLLELQRSGETPRARWRGDRIVLPLGAPDTRMDITRDAELDIRLVHLRRRRRRVEVGADVRLRGVRISRLPLRLLAGDHSHPLVVHRHPDGERFWFETEVPLEAELRLRGQTPESQFRLRVATRGTPETPLPGSVEGEGDVHWRFRLGRRTRRGILRRLRRAVRRVRP